MTIALLTHPRSGSTKLIKCLYNSLSIDRELKNLGEFFQITNSKNFGNLYPNTNAKYIDTKAVDLLDPENYLKDVQLPGSLDLNSYIKNEMSNRVLFMDQLNDLKIDHVFKYFFYNKPNKIVYDDLYSFLNREQVIKIVLYRKNLLSSICSHLIKEKIINQKYSKNDHDHFRSAGHNYGDMAPLTPTRAIYVPFGQFRTETEIFFNFYSYLEKNSQSTIIEYEKLFSQNVYEISIRDHLVRIDLSTDSEVLMNYAVDKSEFFSNSNEFPKFILKILTEKKLLGISKKLDLIYDLE